MVEKGAVLLLGLLRLLVVTSQTTSEDNPQNILLPAPIEEALIDDESTETPYLDAGNEFIPEEKRSEDSTSWSDPDQQDQLLDPHNSNNFIRLGRGKDNNFLRFGRGGKSNFLRFGKAGSNNFLRFGRADRNFLRFGRPNNNFLRFGRTSSNFLRFGRGKDNNFLRFGRDGDDDLNENEGFLRLDRGGSNNFLRLGRDGEGTSEASEGLMRVDRGKSNNFLRFGRDTGSDSEDTEGLITSSSDSNQNSESADNMLRMSRSGNPSNFIRFGRSRGNQNFIRLGKADNFIRFGRKDNFLRFGRDAEKRSSKSHSLHFGRGKLADRNFIRLGRSSDQSSEYNRPHSSDLRDDFIRLSNGKRGGNRPTNNFLRLGNGKRAHTESFIRMDGKREDETADDSVIRLSRDVETKNNLDAPEENNSSVYELNRSKRSIDSEDHGGASSTNDYNEADNEEDQKSSQMLFDNLQGPFRYYSPLAVGLPNYILAPELSLLPPVSQESLAKRAKSGGTGSNFIRLG